MTEPPQHLASSPYPGWVWDAASNQWVPEQQQWQGQQQWQQQPSPQQWQQQWQGGYPQQHAPQALPGPTLGQHLKRAVDWNVSDLPISPRERTQLEAAGVVEPRMQALLAWRRSTLLVALPILLLGVVLAVVDKASAGTPKVGTLEIQLTPLGQLARWLPVIALALVPLAMLMGVSRWTELRRPSRVLIACWVLSIVIPLITALLPIDALFDFDPLRNLAAQSDLSGATMTAGQEVHALILSQRVALAVQYALVLLPVIITVPSGVLKGAGRMRFLFPAAALPGWFLISVAPFYSIFLIVVFILIDQIVGNFLLVVAIGLMAFSPWLFVLRRRVYGRAMSIAEARVELPKAGRLGGYITVAALALLTIWMLTAKVENTKILGSGSKVDAGGAAFSYVQAARTALEVFGRNLVTAVVFAMIFLSMVFAEWRAGQQLSPETRAEHDREMHALRRYAEGQAAAPKQAV